MTLIPPINTLGSPPNNLTSRWPGLKQTIATALRKRNERFPLSLFTDAFLPCRSHLPRHGVRGLNRRSFSVKLAYVASVYPNYRYYHGDPIKRCSPTAGVSVATVSRVINDRQSQRSYPAGGDQRNGVPSYPNAARAGICARNPRPVSRRFRSFSRW